MVIRTRRYRHPLLDEEDFAQMGWLGLKTAVRDWDPKKGPFEALAYLRVQDAIRAGIIAAKPTGYKTRDRATPSTYQVEDIDLRNEIWTHAFEDVDVKLDLQAMLKHPEVCRLTSWWARDAFRYRLRGWTLKQMQAKFGVSESSICNYIKSVRDAIQTVYAKDLLDD